MIAKIRTYINRAFEDVPRTKKSMEMQEELISNLIEKFNDQLRLGKSEEEAYTSVIASIGDLSELTEGMRERHVLSGPTPQERKRSAMFVTIAVMLYILSPMVLIVFSQNFGAEITGLAGMFTLIAIATGLLVYNQASKPRYLKEDETLVEEFKEWKSSRQKNKSIYDALSSAFWLIIVAVYLYVSFTYMNWHYSWIIFIIGAAIQNIVKALLEMRGDHEK
ncbi:MAG: permease prefix domain 1-containing protein [Erysipelotrichaceae bacterium]